MATKTKQNESAPTSKHTLAELQKQIAVLNRMINQLRLQGVLASLAALPKKTKSPHIKRLEKALEYALAAGRGHDIEITDLITQLEDVFE